MILNFLIQIRVPSGTPSDTNRLNTKIGSHINPADTHMILKNKGPRLSTNTTDSRSFNTETNTKHPLIITGTQNPNR